jgi:acyl-CoA synthetase (AMP-forming)/AMP-acid ligase II
MESLVENLVAQAAARPGAPAYVDGHGELSYGELLERARRAAAWLRERGVRPDGVVALTLEHESARASLFLFYGAAYLGATLLLFFPEIPLKGRRELGARYGARWHFKASMLKAPAQRRNLPVPPRGDRAERPFLYSFSSGTTGEPKALLFTHAQMATIISRGAAIDRWHPDDRILSGRRWPTKVALRYILRVHVAGGAYVRESFPQSRDQLARLIHRRGVTGVCGSPAAMREILATRLSAGESLPALRTLRVSGAAATPAELRALRAEITPNVYCSYGTTELGLIASLRPEEPVSEPLALQLFGEGLEAQVVDESGAPLAPGEVGRLRYRAPWMARGYVDNPAASARQFRDGWFYPGDLGAIDAAGRVSLRGREDDQINWRGLKVLPAEIEPVLLGHPQIADAVVLGAPDEQAGQVPVAFVVPRGGRLDLAALRRYCEERCGARSPLHFLVLPSLPRNAAGKVARAELLARFATGFARVQERRRGA